MRLLRNALLPFALMAAALFAMGAQILTSTLYHRLAWPQTMATVTSSETINETGKDGAVTQRLDLTLSYQANGAVQAWSGKGSDIGVYRASVGERIQLHFDPGDPSRLDKGALKGWRGGLLLLSVSGGFVAFYVWFFWLRRRNAPPPAGPRTTAMTGRTAVSPNPGQRASFGRR